ncbi:UNVERIFIED_CONTAM: Cell division cycle-associated 7-like protein [Sesamum radiatum]|uniref:Cell division cycle-associated 7-like protein n=1 Tax=Sesamum radiatum TaxID=300843 RepID=A0AAW2VQ98_SESRA
MAVDSGSVSKQSVSRKKERLKSPEKKVSKSHESVVPPSPAKRNKSPGIRVVGGRIYDSVNGKTCHQVGVSCASKKTLLLFDLRGYGVRRALESRVQLLETGFYLTEYRSGSFSVYVNETPPPNALLSPRLISGVLCKLCTRDQFWPNGWKVHIVCRFLLYHISQVRYGEQAEEVAALGEWSCPKCRGICNCSICMKKRGHQPTGMLINMAKATGFSSVSELLLKGAECLNHENVVADVVASPKKEVVPSPRKRGKENSFDGKVDANLPNPVDKKPKKVKKVHRECVNDNTSLKIVTQSPDKRKLKQEGLEDKHDGNNGPKDTGSRGSEKKSKKKKRDRPEETTSNKIEKDTLTEISVHDVQKKPKKLKKDEFENNEVKKNDTTLARRTSPRKLKDSNKVPNQGATLNIGVNPEESMKNRIRKDFVEPLENDERKEDDGNNTANDKIVLEQQYADFHAEVPLPVGTELNSVAGIDVSTEDVGNVLQFLEFCAVFGKASDFIYKLTPDDHILQLSWDCIRIILLSDEILEVKKGQPECILRDLLHGRTGRRGKFSATVQFHIHLLSILQTEQGEECAALSPSNGKNSWFHALKKCLTESRSDLKAQGLDSLEKAADYETLEASEKLRLLNLLCDEVLGTEKVRNWIDDQNTKLAEMVKEAKQKVLAAKDKEKSLKKKMKDDIAKAIMARHGAPLSISEHEAIVARIKIETAQAHARMLESKGMLLKNNRTSDAVRVEPIFMWHDGHAYWKLSSFGKSEVLHQDAGKGDALTLDEKWFAIDDQGKEAIEKHVSSLRSGLGHGSALLVGVFI